MWFTHPGLECDGCVLICLLLAVSSSRLSISHTNASIRVLKPECVCVCVFTSLASEAPTHTLSSLRARSEMLFQRELSCVCVCVCVREHTLSLCLRLSAAVVFSAHPADALRERRASAALEQTRSADEGPWTTHRVPSRDQCSDPRRV